MTSPLRHALDLVSYAATRRSHDRHDASTVADLMVEPSDLGLPPGLEVRWLGVAGFALSYQGTTVLIDPFVSRVPMADMMKRRALVPSRALIDAWVPRADAVLVG
ncbi:MAG: MBL fold metallo-hydrolase, partial [Acidimicrobiales bacterium]|nr:MBL fold metallo-hydrolase [Acidimicrobiales bacterium]